MYIYKKSHRKCIKEKYQNEVFVGMNFTNLLHKFYVKIIELLIRITCNRENADVEEKNIIMNQGTSADKQTLALISRHQMDTTYYLLGNRWYTFF